MTEQPPQFTVTTTLNGEQIGAQEIHDPFVTTTTRVGLEDLRRLVEEERDLVVIVRVDGTRAAIRHVMQPIDLTPNTEQPHPIEGAYAAEETPQP